MSLFLQDHNKSWAQESWGFLEGLGRKGSSHIVPGRVRCRQKPDPSLLSKSSCFIARWARKEETMDVGGFITG